MNSQFAYDKMDYYSVLEYLKQQAKYFSNGTWTDFSDADIGTVILKLMAMNTDTTNYQVEKGISELYIDTVVERANAVALCKLIGYEPRHYESAMIDISLTGTFVGDSKLPAYTLFTNTARDINYYNITEYNLKSGTNIIDAYEGSYKSVTKSLDDITVGGTILLDDYNIGTNTFRVSQAGSVLKHIDNALYGESEACYSVHLNADNQMYIQFPPYYNNFITNATITIEYLISNGVEGRVGAEIISGSFNLNGTMFDYVNKSSSEGGFNPETVEEIRNEAPRFASTMNTLVTLNDFRILSKDFDGISDVVALDYNYPESGLIQPDGDGNINDAYKVNIYVLPTTSDSIYEDDGVTYSDIMTKYINDVRLKKPSSIQVNYYNVEYVRPHIFIKVYLDKYDLRYDTVANSVKRYLVDKYSRYNRKIGQALYKSQLSSEILSAFDYIKYLEVVSLEGESNGALKVNNLQYIDLLFDNISIMTVPYTEE